MDSHASQFFNLFWAQINDQSYSLVNFPEYPRAFPVGKRGPCYALGDNMGVGSIRVGSCSAINDSNLFGGR